MFRIGRKDNERLHLKAMERHFYINGPIDDEEDYTDLIDALYMGKPEDSIYIHLNTPGGRLDITMQLLNAISSSHAEVVGIADGQVASAGGLILFSCPNIAVMPFSYVMLHDGSGGQGGKINENLKEALFYANLTKKIFHESYFPFFSKEEIDAVLDGKDMWIGPEELKKRINDATKVVKNKEKGKDAKK